MVVCIDTYLLLYQKMVFQSLKYQLIIVQENLDILHFFGSIGFTLISVGFIISLYLTLGWLNGIWIANRPMFFLGILLLILGVQFFSMGLIGELIIKISHQNKNIPLKVYKKEI